MVVRSLTHASNDHSAGHMIMLSGRTQLPPDFNRTKPTPTDWPSMAAVASHDVADEQPAARGRAARTADPPLGPSDPGQLAGVMGPSHDPRFIEASPFNPNGAFPRTNSITRT